MPRESARSPISAAAAISTRPRGNGAARRRRHRRRRVAGAAGGGALESRDRYGLAARGGRARPAQCRSVLRPASAPARRDDRGREIRPASAVVPMGLSCSFPVAPPTRPTGAASAIAGSPNATAGHAIAPPAGGANVAGFVEPTTLITGLIGDRVMAQARSTQATAAPLARWSRAYSALARQPSARSMAGFEMASRNLANTMSARLGTTFTPADICARCRVRCRHPQRRNSSHPTCRKCDCELRVQKGHWNDNIARAVLINSRLFVDLADVRFTPYRDR